MSISADGMPRRPHRQYRSVGTHDRVFLRISQLTARYRENGLRLVKQRA